MTNCYDFNWQAEKMIPGIFFIVIHLSFSAHSLVKPNNMIELAHIVWNDVTARY